jgi:hypothetical protein
MKSISLFVAGAFLCVSTVNAQFQFFEQMFQGQGQQQEPQNVASDSGWYQETYENGAPPHLLTLLKLSGLIVYCL